MDTIKKGKYNYLNLTILNIQNLIKPHFGIPRNPKIKKFVYTIEMIYSMKRGRVYEKI